MGSSRLFFLGAIAAVTILLMQPVAAATLGDVFGAFVRLGKRTGEPGFDEAMDVDNNGVINFGDIVLLLQLIFGLGRGRIACSSDADCGGTVQGDPFCDGNKVMYTVIQNFCLNPGARQSRCDSNAETFLHEACPYGCSAGSCFNQPPIADAGVDQTVSEGEEVSLDANASYDHDGNITAYEWKEGATVLSTEMAFGNVFSVGLHTVTLTVTDDSGLTGTDAVVIDVSPAGMLTAKKLWTYSFPYYYSCAILNDSTVKCWGINSSGQLGDGTTADKLTPVSVLGISGVKAIATGKNHVCALLNDNSVKCWGNNSYGQLGNGTTIDSLTPVSVVGISNVKAISAGREHSCALLSDNSVKCWGWNAFGMLGNGTFTDSLTPVSVLGLSNVKTISSGYLHSCALLSDNSIKCWGNNVSGRLGDGTQTNRSTPVSVSGITNAMDVEVGGHHSCTLLNANSVKCWGANASGQLGNGTSSLPSLTPVSVVGLSNVTDLKVGYSHSCVLLTDNTVKCWGHNAGGGLGDGTSISRLSPVSVLEINNARAIAVGRLHSCALLTDNSMKCWGYNWYGGLGNGESNTHSYTPVQVVS